MGDMEGDDPSRGARVELGEFFLEEIAGGELWTFGRGQDFLITGLSTEEAFLLVVNLRRKLLH